MKKLILVGVSALFCSLQTAHAQSDIIGVVDVNGNNSITVLQLQAKQILENVSHFTEPQPFQATEITLTNLPTGEICLTGYIKNPVGHIVRGFRVVCIQDDGNNLIVQPGTHVERINGRAF